MKNNKTIKYIIPNEFINNIFFDKIDVNIQSDLNEFYLALLERIEKDLYNTPNENLI